MKNLSLTFLGCIFVALLSCNGNQKLLSESDYGDAWPFSVSSGTVQCNTENYAIVFISGGVAYALNDAAREIENYADINLILKPDTNYHGRAVMMDTSPIEFEGLKLCNRSY